MRRLLFALEGGTAADRLESGPDTLTLVGWAGDDVLRGGPRGEHVNGGAGDDDIAAGAGNDAITGEAGADSLSGGEGEDEVSYAYSEAPVRLTIGGGPDDGAAGEGDYIGTDVEELVGSRRADAPRGSCVRGLARTVRRGLPSRTISRDSLRCVY